MRILFLHPKAWTGEHALLRELARLGHEVCVLEERRGRGTREFSDWLREPGDGLRTLWYDPARGWMRLATWLPDRVFRRAFDGRNVVHRMLVIAEAARRFRPDAVIASDGFSYGVPAGIAKRAGLVSPRLVVSYIGGDILDCPQAGVGHRRTPLTDWLIRTSLGGVDAMRAVSPMLAAVLLEDGAPRERVRVLPSHLVADRATLGQIASRRAECREAARRRHGFAPDAPLIVTLSGNHRGKGLHVLARAWPAILSAVPQARWLLCGAHDPWLDSDVWPQLEREGIASTVVATGRIEGLDVFRYLAAADLHVNPSLCESLNMVTVEAAAVGTPTIGTDGAGVEHWIRRHGAGAVVPRGEAGPLGDAIIFSLQHADRLRAWSLALPALAEEFALERIAASLVALLKGDPDEMPHTRQARP